MTLQNLLKIQSLIEFKAQREATAAVVECIKQAQALLAHVRGWLAEHHPDFC